MTDTTYAVLVHGWAGSPRVWDGIDWPDDWNVHAYTLPGHGERRDDGPWTIPSAAEDLADYIRNTVPAGKQALLIAHSMGGQLSLAVHANHPELVAGEVVIDPAYGAMGEEATRAFHERFLERMSDDPTKAVLDFIEGAHSPAIPGDVWNGVLSDVHRTNPQALVDYYVSEYLAPGAFGVCDQTVPVARKRTKPTFGIYPGVERARFEQSCGTFDVTVWSGGHRHFLFLEDPRRFRDEVVGWALSRKLYVPSPAHLTAIAA
ncbi:alpha/beta hydrolase [Bifidobacterium sp. 82T10]|uniref:Alpha/beta hydrolase n=1 Tax=Bifidobacterium miconis TaxID=2834435 RepID=A0ABS6WJD5_9BIFI|nr:alpha/beta hydrolase [Bifidobacterium miconis]MBW3093336.1 alpha/beta hydrolase [Bifidobacterium miconis]